jgi:hypothetical protein
MPLRDEERFSHTRFTLLFLDRRGALTYVVAIGMQHVQILRRIRGERKGTLATHEV